MSAAAPIAAMLRSPATPAATGTAPNVKVRRERHGSRRDGRGCCPCRISTWSSPCRRRWPPSHSRTRLRSTPSCSVPPQRPCGSLRPTRAISAPRSAVSPCCTAGAMGADPVRKVLGRGRLGVGVVRGAQHADEDLRRAHFTGRAVDDVQRIAGVVDEDALAGDMMLAHGRRQPPLPAAVEVAEPAVSVAVLGMDGAVLLPHQRERDPLAPKLAMDRRPVRLRQAAPRLAARRREKPALDVSVGRARRQRPGQAGAIGALKVLRNRRLSDRQARRDLPGRKRAATIPSPRVGAPTPLKGALPAKADIARCSGQKDRHSQGWDIWMGAQQPGKPNFRTSGCGDKTLLAHRLHHRSGKRRWMTWAPAAPSTWTP